MGLVITYGAGDYGQLGHGWQWDDSQPRLVKQLNNVFQISAGWRHTVAVRKGADGISQVYSWGYNGFGISHNFFFLIPSYLPFDDYCFFCFFVCFVFKKRRIGIRGFRYSNSTNTINMF